MKNIIYFILLLLLYVGVVLSIIYIATPASPPLGVEGYTPGYVEIVPVSPTDFEPHFLNGDTVTVYQDLDILYFIPVQVGGYSYALLTEASEFTVLLHTHDASSLLYWLMEYPLENWEHTLYATEYYRDIYNEKILN